VPALKDPTQLIITAPDPFGRAQLLSPSSDGLIDAGNLVALYRRYTQVCYVGRNNPQFMLTFFKNPSGQQTTVAPEDCVPYSAAALQVVNQGGSGWALVSGGTQLGLLVTAFDAAVASAVAAHASTECFIGRRTTRPSSSAFITEYWK
jgi:hypothetical protein